MTNASLSVRVARKSTEALDICALELVDAQGDALPAFSAGSHVDVHLPNGLVRQYSLCNDPTESHRYLIAVLKDPGSRGGSRAVHEQIRVGETLSISRPRNHFELQPNAKKSLLLAGGIGITPLLCMAERLATVQADFDLHYCTRSRERTAFRERILRSGFAPRVRFHHDDEQGADLEALLAQPTPGVHLYVCGPKGFMDAVIGTAKRLGWADDHVHYEYFASTVVASEDDGAFEIQLASSGRVISVPPSRTAAQALADAGVVVATSCEQGVCGTCLTRVLDGQPEHRDMYLSPDEQAQNNCFLPCCSRSLSPRLVLDL
ncbi:PDR/VanB family oxidoreductase [Hydrogenophaga sp. 2FB]|uniref:PDR/VanB family oxidoreductase n=1 Tax=Hydrogenophaga sp. 2FB TaxID=2502187 RepID=UPI0010F62AB1|nr:PDR/VanB family oxidoreductase [Hydrogenophaga sp. 2FB]